MDWLIRMYGSEPDPIHSGDTKSWFFFYKWDISHEVHFDIHDDIKEAFYSEAKEGDRLWFVMDQELVGYVDVLRVQRDPSNPVMWEIWYDGAKCHRFDAVVAPEVPAPESTGTVVPPAVAQEWIKHCQGREA